MIHNAIIIFTSDNGGPASGLNHNWATNWPLRGTKTTVFEGSTFITFSCNYPVGIHLFKSLESVAVFIVNFKQILEAPFMFLFLLVICLKKLLVK